MADELDLQSQIPEGLDTSVEKVTEPQPSSEPSGSGMESMSTEKDTYSADELRGLLTALDKERDNNRQKDKILEEKARRDAIYKEIDPDRYKELEQADQRRVAFEAEMKERERSREERYMQGLREKDTLITRLKQEVVEKDKKVSMEKVFMAAKGRAGSGHNNVSFFDTFYGWASSNFKFDETGDLVVVDRDGNHVIDNETSNRIDPAKYIEKIFKADEVMSWVFEPEMGAGGGMVTNRGRGTTGKDLQNLSKKELYNLGWGS